LWPTPRAEKTTEEDPDVWMERHKRGDVATPPLALAVKMYPTPIKSDATRGVDPKRKDREGSGGDDLVTRVLFPTPTENDYGYNQGGSMGREGQPPRPSLQHMARHNLWPTPTVMGNHNKSEYSSKAGDGLAHAVRKKLWPTPTSRDHKDTPGMATEGPDGRNRVDMLARAVYNPEKRFPTPRGSEGGEGSRQQLESLENQGHISSEEKSSMQSGSGGRLNPDWVEWLMGLPIGWTALRPLETQSFPPSHSGLEGES
jgi:hypothetical protein